MQSLPKEILSLVLLHYQREEGSILLRSVCKLWKEIIPQKNIRSHSISVYLAGNGYLNLLKMHIQADESRKCRCIFVKAAERGHVEVLRWTYSIDRKIWPLWIRCMSMFSETDVYITHPPQLSILRWAEEEAKILRCDYAHRDRVHFICTAAIRSGDMDILRWLVEKKCQAFMQDALSEACVHGRLDILEFADANGIFIDDMVVRTAFGWGRIDIMNWLKSKGYLPNKETLLHYIWQTRAYAVAKAWIEANL